MCYNTQNQGVKKVAKNTGENKRIAVKWIRDRAKAAYTKQDCCYVCGTQQDLELHHVYSITRLLERWAHHNGIQVDTDEQVLEIRDRFIAEHHREIYELVYTLCNKHHVQLHGVYGKKPQFGTETKQSVWIERQKAKYSNTAAAFEDAVQGAGGFSKFY